MQTLATIAAMQAFADAARAAGRRIAFVPTMGFLHEGHAALMRAAHEQADVTVVSIFVNPTQFGPQEDLSRYPRSPEADLALCEREGVGAVFTPGAAEMYPPGAQTWVEVADLSRGHCGASRPGHFRGVATVVTKLFLAVKPHVAVFGEKDFQQLAVIRRLVHDLNFDVQILGIPTVREADGLAMSSRNAYLSTGERQRALALSRGLTQALAAFTAGERDARTLTKLVEVELANADAEIDYIHLVDALTLGDVDTLADQAVLLVAARIGTTRLIDNLTLATVPPASGSFQKGV